MHRLLPVFLLPTGIVLILLFIGIAKRRWKFIWAAALVFFVCSMPVTGSALVDFLERGQQRSSVESFPPSDAIVVLSSGRATAPGPGAVSEWHDPDRYFAGVELFAAARAPLVVFTGGDVEGQPPGITEGKILAAYARKSGIPDSSIAVSGQARNTEEEAGGVHTLLSARLKDSSGAAPRKPRIILVSSAFHLPRAKMLFESEGMVVTPFPVDFLGSSHRPVSPLSFIPSAGGLRQTEFAIRELYGRLFYSIAR
ncbi:MAG: YdcF family protein [Gemmatimonadaceae bacterium]|nr:YdcF family protein [Gemmatimonadaceae bacterium]